MTQRRGRRDPLADAEKVRRATAVVTAGAIGLGGVLFVQVGVSTIGVDELDQQVISVISALLPGLRPANQAPAPSPGAPPVVVSGGS